MLCRFLLKGLISSNMAALETAATRCKNPKPTAVQLYLTAFLPAATLIHSAASPVPAERDRQTDKRDDTSVRFNDA